MRISDWSSDVCSSDLAVTEDRRNRQSAVGILSRQYGIVAVLDEQIGPRFELIVVNQLGVQGNKVRHFPEELGARQSGQVHSLSSPAHRERRASPSRPARKSAASGKRVTEGVDISGGRNSKKKK